MQDVDFYLNDGRFTGRNYVNLNDIAGSIAGKNLMDSIDKFVESLHGKDGKADKKVWRERTASQIVEDGFVTGCTDSALVFVTLARIKGIPTAYVESIEENFLQNPTGGIQGHVFVDIYQAGKWVSYNPGRGATDKQGKVYCWIPTEPNRRYIEIARGLDFSQLYTDDKSEPIELLTEKQIMHLINKLHK